MNTPITKEHVKNHWGYASWKYIVLVIVAIFGWNLIYTMTAYRPPEEKKVTLIATCLGESDLMDAYMENVRLTEMSDMEEMSSILMLMDETYGDMQLSTYLGAGEGDIYILNKDEFQGYASSGAFVALENLEGLSEIIEQYGFDVDKGWRIDTEIGEKHLFGIPLTNLPGMKQYLYSNEERYAAIAINNMNDENVVKFFKIFLQDMAQPVAETTESVTAE